MKKQKATYAVFASQFFKAFQVFCQENKVEPDMKNYELLKSFYQQKRIAKPLNAQLKTQAKRDRIAARSQLGTRVRPNAVKYNKGFNLINGDCLVEQKPISDKTQVCEPEYTVIQ